ncbi:subtilisin-like protease [Polyplosphaeria fusca]|uniref:Subtilisin-like protease n=1 Tax=Polyplosphaeria fusca TaxID=682080 RepID=A0A9P4UY91_9PLEO|nr:subtilisin-like protease [Polyplosphaeria fusca]
MRLSLVLHALCITEALAAAPITHLDSEKIVPNSFIVVLKKDVSSAAFKSHLTSASKLLSANAIAPESTFDFDGLKGYHLKASPAVAKQLAESDEVSYIEADQTFTLPPITPSKPLAHRAVQSNVPSWGLARISHRKKGSTDYVYQQTSGTYTYIIDSGVHTSHTLFQGRAIWGANFVSGSTNDDENGHGTHVAGTAASQTYGVLRFGGIISVKVLGRDGSTATSILIQGINWAVNDMKTRAGATGRSTALLAVGGSVSTALNNAVAAGSSAGLFFAVVAGNENQNTGNTSPGSEPSACTVGGTTISDERMSSSNYGAGVDIFAPGGSIPSLWYTSNTAIATLSGTSMAAAHIAGLGAYFLALEGTRTPAALCARLQEVATKNVLTGIPSGTPNLLAYNLSGL